MMIKGSARKGGMPLYKFVGNRILTTAENAALGTNLSEFHSGYRAYSVRALEKLPFENNADGFNFGRIDVVFRAQFYGCRQLKT
jgi:hypothetical protein